MAPTRRGWAQQQAGSSSDTGPKPEDDVPWRDGLPLRRYDDASCDYEKKKPYYGNEDWLKPPDAESAD